MREPLWLTRRVLKSMLNIANSRKHDVEIGEKNKPTYYRWHVLGNKPPKPGDAKPFSKTIFRCKVYLHLFVRSDGYDLHDHISVNISWVLSPVGYSEERFLTYPNPLTGKLPGTHIVNHEEGKLIFRLGRTAHRVILHEDAYSGLQPCWSLFIVLPSWREWGFWCPSGRWKHNSEYSSNTYGVKGPGCDG